MSHPGLGTVLLVAGAFAVVAILAVLVAAGVLRPVDRAIIEAVRAPVLLEPLAPLRAITELGSTWAVILVAVLIVPVAFALGPWLHGLAGAAVVGLTSLGNTLVKELVARERPDLLEPLVTEPGYSFPSGHSILGMTAWGVLAVLVSRSGLPRPARIGLVALLAVLIALIGLSRVYLGVHYPTDVVAGWIAGGVIVLLFARITRAVPTAPGAGAADADRGAPRSGRPATD